MFSIRADRGINVIKKYLTVLGKEKGDEANPTKFEYKFLNSFVTALTLNSNKNSFLVNEGTKIFEIPHVKTMKKSFNLSYYYTIHVGLTKHQGSRKYMEDRSETKSFEPFPDILPNFKIAYIGVYDGHAGLDSVELVLNNLCDIITKNWKSELIEAIIAENICSEIKSFDIGTNKRNQVEKLCIAILTKVIQQSFIHMQEILENQYKRTEKNNGTTAVISIFVHNKLFTIHCGDSRAIMIRGGNYVQLTEDHKPNSPGERRRIEDLGSKVKRCGPIYRIDNNLSVARALGDCALKVCFDFLTNFY